MDQALHLLTQAPPPSRSGKDEVRAYLSYLAARRHVSASTQNQAFAALLFLYRQVLGRDRGSIGEVVRVKQPRRRAESACSPLTS